MLFFKMYVYSYFLTDPDVSFNVIPEMSSVLLLFLIKPLCVVQHSSIEEREHLQVYLRIRPFTSAESHNGESQVKIKENKVPHMQGVYQKIIPVCLVAAWFSICQNSVYGIYSENVDLMKCQDPQKKSLCFAVQNFCCQKSNMTE